MAFKRCLEGHLFNSRGNICPYCQSPSDTETSFDANEPLQEEFDPVCGWLVCIEGPRQGESFELHNGKNFIGRGKDMDVRLIGDNSVANCNHAVIAYDDRKQQFTLIPGGSGIVYLHGSAVLTPTPLKDMGIIQLGRVKLLFMSLCGKSFTWNFEEIDD